MRAPHLKRLDVICLDPTNDVQKRYEQFISFPGFRYKSIDLKRYIGSFRDGRDGFSVKAFHGFPAIWFTGTEENHERMMAG